MNETKLRSFFKSGSTRIVEIVVDTAILYVVGIPVWEGISISIGIEFLCFSIAYISERLWNKIQWGRKIEHE